MSALVRRFWSKALLCVSLLAAPAFATPEPAISTFTARSFAEIKEAHAGRPFIVSFWSVSCEPCRREMSLLVDQHRKHPKVSIVLVAADPPSTRAAVVRILRTYRLGEIATWQFGDESSERLRYSVDKRWAGELPRTYFFNAAHESTAQSGVVEESWLNDWMAEAGK